MLGLQRRSRLKRSTSVGSLMAEAKSASAEMFISEFKDWLGRGGKRPWAA